MRLVTWNIRFGGKHRLKSEIAHATTQFGADVVVLTEYRLPTDKGDLLKELRDVGWEYMLASPVTNNKALGVLAISKTPITPLDLPGPDFMPYRYLHFAVEGSDIEIMGLYIPPVNPRNDNKRLFWNWMTENAPLWTDRKLVITGDLNTAIYGIDEEVAGSLFFTDKFQEVLDAGFIDAYRHFHPDKRTYSWWSAYKRLGLRLDHCLVTHCLQDRLKFADYVVRAGRHELVEAKRDLHAQAETLSDHAAMLVDFDETDLK